MITYEKLVYEQKLISPSVAEFLFNLNDDMGIRMLRSPTKWPRTAYNICLLYSALIQAFVIGKALNESNVNENFTIEDLNISRSALNSLKSYWNVEEKKDLADELSAISFLISWCNCGIDEIIGDQSAISPITSAYSKYLSQASLGSLTEEQFMNFLRALPLLRYTTLDLKEQKIIFDTGKEHIETKCVPFITFWDEKVSHTVAKQTTNCYIFTSVSASEEYDELIFNGIQLNSYNADKPKIKRIRRNVTRNESLKALCKIVGMESDWFPIENSCCDLLFLIKLTEAAASISESYWKKNRQHFKQFEKTILKLRELFKGSEFYYNISTEKELENHEQIKNKFMELFINHGLYKSMYCLFQDDQSTNDSKYIFEMFLDYLKKENIIDEEQKQKYIELCNNTIEQHKFKLEKITKKDLLKYNKRSHEIEAEWRAYYVLKAAGLTVEKLFADQEEILSIDDYCALLINSSSDIMDDLSDVLQLLVVFYGSLINTEAPYNEENHLQEIKAYKKAIQGFSVEQLFNEFVSIAEKSQDNRIIYDLLGRKKICDLETLTNFKNDILSAMAGNTSESEETKNLNKYVFVSYAHEDQERVKAYVTRWKELGYDIYWDVDRFKPGTNWEVKAIDAIKNPSCTCVFWFLSENMVFSKPICTEIEVSVKQISERGVPNEKFIIPINLEDKQPEAYLEPASKKTEEKYYYCADTFRDVLKQDRILNISYKDSDLMETCLKERLVDDNDDSFQLEKRALSDTALEILNFYAFLKYNTEDCWMTKEKLIKHLEENPDNDNKCIFPMIISVKETKIKRDKITLAGYEVIKGKNQQKENGSYILSSKRLNADDYFFIPNSQNSSASDGSWVVEPFLIPHDLFSKQKPEDTK